MITEAGFSSFRERNPGRPLQMISLEIVPGRRCQLSCRNCYKRGPSGGPPERGRPGDTPVGLAEAILAQAGECGFCEAAFIGGEPTLHPALPRLVEGALARGLAPVVCTNGIRMADPGYAAEVARPGTTVLMHAPLPEAAARLHDAHVGMPGYNALLHAAAANLIGRPGVRLVAEIVIIRPFLPYIPEVHRWCLRHGARPFIEMNRRHDTRAAFPESASPEETRELFGRLAGQDPNPPEVMVPPAYGQPCTMSITGLHVKNHGGGDCARAYSCCAQGICHGDLRTDRLATVLARPSLEVFRHQDAWIAGPCRECADYRGCRGGCRGEAFLTFGCARASCPVCWKIPAAVRSDPAAMCPPDCAGCPLEKACQPRGAAPAARLLTSLP